MYFPINDLYTVKVKKFYTLDELDRLANITISKKSDHLWIGELENERKLGIFIDLESEYYGRIILAKNDEVEICDYSFEKFAKYAQGLPKQPEIFAAEENNADFLKKRLSEGWDCNTKYRYNNAVRQAAEYNSHDALRVLLEARAGLGHNNHRKVTWLYDSETMDILDEYQNE